MGLLWLKAQHTTTLRNFLRVLAMGQQVAQAQMLPLLKEAQNTRTRRSRRWLSTESTHLLPSRDAHSSMVSEVPPRAH